MGSLFAALALAALLPVQAIAEGKTGSVAFERNDRLLTWRNTNNGEFQYRPNLRLNFNSELSTSLSMTTGSTLSDRWYDQVNNSAGFDYGFSDKLDLGFSLVELWNKDTMSRVGSSFLTTDVGGKVNYRPFGGMDLQGTLGHKHDERFENRDNGAVATGKILYNLNPAGAFRNVTAMVDVSGETSTLRRSKDNGRVYARVAYRNPLADMSMELTDNRSVRGYFAESTDDAGVSERKDIEERASYDRDLKVMVIRGNLSDDWNVSGIQMMMGLGDRRIDDSANDKDPKSPKYHTNSNGSLEDFTLRGKRTFGRFRGEMEAGYNRNENNVQRAIRSRTQTDVSTRGKLDIVLTRADSLNVVGWIKRTRIDTPAVVHNDRDELKFEGGLLWLRRWAEDFNTMMDFRVLETHYVNIDVTQSSQNKWMRTYRLSPSFEYTPSDALRVRHEVGLQADYMDFDFDKGPTPRSTITRRVSSETWLTGILSPAVKTTAGVMFEENEYGRLNTKGSKIPVEEGIRRFLDLSVRYEFARWLIFIPQYVYAIRKDRSVERGTLERREVDQTFGMDMLLFENRARDGHDFRIGCKRIVRDTAGNAPQIRNYISMTLTYGF
ncbi:MAG: hypothetical protein ACYC9O_10595 [Candidatus Latescibacterota bacterium]